MLKTFEPQNSAENKNAEAHLKNPCSYKIRKKLQIFHCMTWRIDRTMGSFHNKLDWRKSGD